MHVQTALSASSSRDQAMLRMASDLLAAGYHFTTPTPETHRRVNARPGNASAGDLNGVFGWNRRFHQSLLPKAIFDLALSAAAIVPHGEAWASRYRLSTLEGMGFLHSAYPTMAADAVFFGPDSYRFARALAAYLKTAAAPSRAVDIGCGAGVAAMMIARAFPQADVIMTDINPEALRLARINAALAGLPRVRAFCGDMLTGIAGDFNLIVSNPPYMVDKLHRAYRDGGGELGDGISLRIISTAVTRLAPGGTLLLYTGAAIMQGRNIFLERAAALLDEAGFGWHAEEIDPDVFGEELDCDHLREVDRIAVILLTATRPLTGGRHA